MASKFDSDFDPLAVPAQKYELYERRAGGRERNTRKINTKTRKRN
jgi:hypothetical protein